MTADKPKSDNSRFGCAKVSKRKPDPTSEQTLKPWEELGISESTYYRRKRLGKI